jgi:hypothetical protein
LSPLAEDKKIATIFITFFFLVFFFDDEDKKGKKSTDWKGEKISLRIG